MAKTQDTTPVAALYKGFKLIELLSAGPDSVANIAARSGMPKSSAYRFLATLMELGIVEKSSENDFELTGQLFEYGGRALDARNLVATLAPFMARLQRQTQETVHFAVRSGLNVIYLHKVDSPHPLRLHSRIGYQAPLYNTALGKAILAWLPHDLAEDIISSITFVKVVPKTIGDAEALRENLAAVRRQGYAFDDEEHQENVYCFAVPVFDHYCQAMGAISIAFPTFRYTEEDREGLIAAMQEAARDASRKLGCTAWPPDEYPGGVRAEHMHFEKVHML